MSSLFLRRSVNRVGFMLVWLCVCWKHTAHAQDGMHFTSNGKRVNVASFNRAVEQMIDDVGVPAISVAVIENDRIVFHRSYGYKDSAKKHKVNQGTLFEGCSLSKTFLVLVAHQLIDEGKLMPDKPLYEYLENKDLAHDLRYKRITTRMVLSHSSGLENWKQFNNRDTLEILNNPGEKYSYSGEGFNYLSRVIGVILGQSYEQYMEERVIKPLHLKRTFLKYKRNRLNPFHEHYPTNFATGHNSFGVPVGKWINYDPIPSSAIHLVAEDYAKVLLGIFGQGNLSRREINQIVTPVVPIREDDPSIGFGQGFAIIYGKHDTLVTHTGSNDGFKAEMFYSVRDKRGFVFFSNADRGRLMTSNLNALTTGFDIGHLYEKGYYEHYPSPAISLLKIYRTQNQEAMFAEIDRLAKSSSLGEKTLNELGDEFMDRDEETAKRLLLTNIELYPQAPTAYRLLGQVYLSGKDYDQANDYFLKAKALNASPAEIDRDLKDCAERKADAARRQSLLVRVPPSEPATIQAENYNAMSGVDIRATSDGGGGQKIGSFNNGDWMEYKVDVVAAGTYDATFRLSSLRGGSKIELRNGTAVLCTVDVPSTDGWENWLTLTTTVEIPVGVSVLRVHAIKGGAQINWVSLNKGKVIVNN